MKTQTFLCLTVCVQIMCVFLQIHKQSLWVQLTYEHQRYLDEKNMLVEQKRLLATQLNTLHSPAYVLARAQQELILQPISLKQVRSIAYENS